MPAAKQLRAEKRAAAAHRSAERKRRLLSVSVLSRPDIPDTRAHAFSLVERNASLVHTDTVTPASRHAGCLMRGHLCHSAACRMSRKRRHEQRPIEYASIQLAYEAECGLKHADS